MTEEEARRRIEAIFWPMGIPTCPRCGATHPRFIRSVRPNKKRRIREGLYVCSSCSPKRQFTVTALTPLHGSRLSMVQWCEAIDLYEGNPYISDRKLHMTIGVTQGRAKFVKERLKELIKREKNIDIIIGDDKQETRVSAMQKGVDHSLITMTEEQAEEWLLERVWPEGPRCLRCGRASIGGRLNDKTRKSPHRQCGSCGAHFSALMGTPLERSHLPMSAWAKVILSLWEEPDLRNSTILRMMGVNNGAMASRIRIRAMAFIDYYMPEREPETAGPGRTKDPDAVSLGRRGGLARMQALPPERRSEIAREAAVKRWNK